MEALLGHDRSAVPTHGGAAREGRPSFPLHVRVPRDAGVDVPLGHPMRPAWRGRVHLIGLALALPSVVALVAAADGGARIGTMVYALGLCSMLAVSVTYHRWVHHLHLRARWRRADHAMIFAAMAGSTTPVAMSVTDGSSQVVIIAATWTLAAAGAICKVAPWERADETGSWLYAAVSFISATLVPALWYQFGVGPAVLCLVSGGLYVLGATWFAKAWPRLRPSVFSFHEVWHGITVLAAAAHFAAVWTIVT